MARRSRTVKRKKLGPKKRCAIAAAGVTLLGVLYANIGTIADLYGRFTSQNGAIGQSLYGQNMNTEQGNNYSDDDFEHGESWTDFSSLLPPINENAVPTERPEGALAVQEVNLQSSGGIPYKYGWIGNKTDLSVGQVEDILKTDTDVKVALNSDEPQVLIVHTHTTESYMGYDLGYYEPGTAFRTTDESNNITRVGAAIAKELNSAGIKTIQDTTLHDYPQYTGGYERSRVTIKNLLEKYPSIKIVIDVHRDGIQYSDGTLAKPTVTVNGKKAAQTMIILGCNSDATPIPNYQNNLRFASAVQSQVEETFPGVTRPMLFDYRFYNQDLAAANFLIEVGSHGNTLAEAVYAGELTGKAMAAYLKSTAN